MKLDWSTKTTPEGHSQASGRFLSLKSIPWLLLVFFWAVMFPVFDQFGSQSYPYDDQFLAKVVQQAQAGDPVNRIAITLLGLSGAWLLSQNRKRIQLQPVITAILFALLAWAAVSPLWSVDPPLSGRRLISLALMVLFSAGVAVRINGASLLLFIAVFPAIGLIAGTVFEILKGSFYPFRTGYRFCGTAPHPNVEGAFLSVSTIGLCWLCFRATGTARKWFFLLTFVVGGFLFLTRSRTSLLAVLGSLAFSIAIILFRDHRRRVPMILASLTLIITMGSLVYLTISAETLKSPFAETLHRSDDEGGPATLSGRVDLWQSLMPYLKSRPLLGYGFDSFWTPERIEDVSADQKWVIGQSHSGYIDLLLSLGIPGAFLYTVLLLYSIGWCTFQFTCNRDSYGAWAAILTFIAIHNLTESINVFSSFTNLTFYMIVLRLAIVRPDRFRIKDPGQAADGLHSSVRWKGSTILTSK